MRRFYVGNVHRLSPKYLADYVTEMAFREWMRRESNKVQLEYVLKVVLTTGNSVFWRRYAQGHHREDEILGGSIEEALQRTREQALERARTVILGKVGGPHLSANDPTYATSPTKLARPKKPAQPLSAPPKPSKPSKPFSIELRKVGVRLEAVNDPHADGPGPEPPNGPKKRSGSSSKGDPLGFLDAPGKPQKGKRS